MVLIKPDTRLKHAGMTNNRDFRMSYKIAVLGAGSWGTTLAMLLAEKESEIGYGSMRRNL